MSHFIYPSINNIGQFQGFNGNELQEEQLREWMKIRGTAAIPSFLYSGGALSAGGGLSVNIAALTAMVSGQVVQTSGNETKGSLNDTAINWIYLQVSRSGGLATDFSFVANTTGITPSDSVLLGSAKCSGGAVVATTSALLEVGAQVSSYIGNGSTSDRLIACGFRPRMVKIYGPHEHPFDSGGNSTGDVSSLATTFWDGGSGGLGQTDDGKFNPKIDSDGFIVKQDSQFTSGTGTPDTTVYSLNKNGSTYVYVAWA